MKAKNGTVIVLLLLATGCGTARFKSRMNDWVGQPIDAVVAAYGPPTSQFKGESATVYGYHFDNGSTSYITTGFTGDQLNTTNNVCDVSFMVQATGLVSGWSSRGRCRQGLLRPTY